MTKSYEKQCMYCNEKIEMSDKSGNWLAYNLNNGLHDCRDKDRPTKQEITTTTQKTRKERLEELRRKLKSIDADIEELFKE